MPSCFAKEASMRSVITRYALLIGLFAGGGSLLANDYLEEACCPYEGCSPLEEWCSGEFVFAGELLYWQPFVTALTYATTNDLTSLGGFSVPTNRTSHDVTFDFSPGFRIISAYELPESGWDLKTRWTHLRASGKDSVEGESLIILWDITTALEVVSSASSKMTTKLDYVDINLGKTWSVCGCFDFHPFFGGCYYRLNVQEAITYVGTLPDAAAASADVLLTNFVRGWGADVGVDGCWHLPGGLGIYGSSCFSTIMANFSLGENEVIIAPAVPADNIEVFSNNTLRSIKEMIALNIGIKWRRDFCCCHYPLQLNLFAGYELNYFFNHIQLTISKGNESNLSGDVSFRGLTAGASLTF